MVVVKVESEHVVRQVIDIQGQDVKAVGTRADIVYAALGGQGRQADADKRQGKGQGGKRTGRIHVRAHYYCWKVGPHRGLAHTNKPLAP